MKLKKTILLVALCLGASSIQAEDIDYVMKISLSDGTVDKYLVDDRPRVILGDKFVRVVAEDISAEYEVQSVVSYTFEDILTGIEDVKDMRSIKVNIKTDKEEYEGNIYMFLAFNGITAGRIPLTRDSHVDDGVMDVIVLEKRNKLLSFSNMLRYVLGGNPDAVRHFRCSEMVVTTNQHHITDVDGERGPNFPLHIICEPRSLKIRM